MRSFSLLPSLTLLLTGTSLAQLSDVMPDWFFPPAQSIVFPHPTAMAAGQRTTMATQVTSLQIKETNLDIHIELSADLLFDFDQATLGDKAQDALKQTAAIIREKAKGQVKIEGHTDGKGDAAYNLKLSDRRAKAVKNWLVDKEGLRASSLETYGYGKDKPVAPNTKPDGSDDPEGRQKNRRVEIILNKSR